MKETMRSIQSVRLSTVLLTLAFIAGMSLGCSSSSTGGGIGAGSDASSSGEDDSRGTRRPVDDENSTDGTDTGSGSLTDTGGGGETDGGGIGDARGHRWWRR